jgi:hypothetical protein
MKTRMSIGTILAVFAACALAESPPAFVGTWKLNLAKSDYAGQTPPRLVVQKNEAVGDAVRQITDGIGADGKPFHTEYTAKFDGKEYPVTGGPPGETIALERVDARTSEWIWRNGAHVVSAGQTVYSPDGRERTLRFTIRGGKEARITAVYERQ